MDKAGWHTAGDLVVPENLSLVFMPPYSPELNPIERLWLHLRDNRLSHCVFQTTGEIVHTWLCVAFRPRSKRRKSIIIGSNEGFPGLSLSIGGRSSKSIDSASPQGCFALRDPFNPSY
jgi:hypothetical protein